MHHNKHDALLNGRPRTNEWQHQTDIYIHSMEFELALVFALTSCFRHCQFLGLISHNTVPKKIVKKYRGC